MRHHVLRLLAPAALMAGMSAAEPATAPFPPLPPVSGELAGSVTLPKIPGLPPFAWRVQARPAARASLAFDATASAPGLGGQMALTLPVGDAAGEWHLTHAKVDLAEWWRHAVDQAGDGAKSIPADLAASGTLTVDGSGQWRSGEFSGKLHIVLSRGSVGSVAQKWSAAGVVIEGEIEFSATRVRVLSVQLGAETLQVASLTTRGVLIEAAGLDDGRLTVKRAEVGAFGGRIALAPFTFDPAAPAVKSLAEFTNVALGDVAVLVPQALSEAHGRVAGRVAIEWSLRSGFGPGDGAAVVSPPEPATVRLAPSPGLLTGRAPPRIALLPASLGPLHRWVSLENPAYTMLQRIELGEAPLAVEGLTLKLFPDGPGGARSASLELMARPTGAGDVVEKVTFEVNISGPLDQVLRLGLDDRAKIDLKPDR